MMSRHEADRLRFEAGITVDEACAFLGRSKRTWQHWKLHGFPDWVTRVLRLRAGYLDDLGWSGWQICNGYLQAPEITRDALIPGDIHAIFWERQLLAYYKKQQREEQLSTSKAEVISLPDLSKDADHG